MKMAKGKCKVCGLEFSLSEQAHTVYREYCPNHWMNMLEDHDLEAIE